MTSVLTRCCALVIVPSRSGRPGTYCETRRVRTLAARSCSAVLAQTGDALVERRA